MNPAKKSSHLIPLLLLTVITLLAAAYYLHSLLTLTEGRLAVPLDDTWIHFQFARNISQGHGFSFNPGDPQPGSTAPLWTLLLSVVGLFSQEFLLPAIVLSGFFLLLTVWLSYGFTVWLTRDRFAGLLAGLSVALTGRLLWAGLAGMETTAFAALSVAAVWLYARQGLRPFPALLFALAGQMRPEGHALFALALLDTVYSGLRQAPAARVLETFAVSPPTKPWQPMRKQLLWPIIIYLLVAAPYTLFSLQVTGNPLPNTFYAKVGSEHFFSVRTLRETLQYHWTDNPFMFILALLGLWPTWKRSRLPVMWLLGLWLLTPIIIDQVWHHGRYTIPLIPFQMIVAAVGLYWLLDTARRQIQTRTGSTTHRPYLSALVLLLLLLGAAWKFQAWATMLGHNAREILEIDVALGEWLAENTPADAVLAIDDIGAVTFLSERKIIDMNGLVSPEMWPAVQQPVGLPRDSSLTRLLSRAQPDYMVAFPLWHWELTQNRNVAQPVHGVDTATHTIIFQPEAYVFETTWPYQTNAAPSQPLEARLGESIALEGYDVALSDTAVHLTLYWRTIQPLPASYDVFVHLTDAAGNIVAQVDEKPLNGLASTDLWQTGDLIRQPLTIPLAAALADGRYHLTGGMYLAETGQRLPATGPAGTNDVIILDDLVVE